ncbi:MAG: RDD family protein [Nitrosomonas sp.]|nr:RDD family protein [Nitrosomonas sp.]
MTNSAPKFRRRLLSLIYEFFLLLAVLMIAGVVFHLIIRDTEAAYFMPLFQFYLVIVMGTYFVWFWTHGGQTLAMQTWKMRVVNAEGNKLEMKQAIVRYLLAVSIVLLFAVAGVLLLGVTGVLFFCVGFVWALFDRDKQFLHDRLAGTRVVKTEG